MDNKDLKIKKYYLMNLTIPLIVSIFLSFVFYRFDYFKSIEEKRFTQFGYLLGIFFQLFIGLLGLTIFLNKKSFIRNNYYFSLLTWFLFPSLVILFFIGYFFYGTYLDKITLIMISSILGYLVILIITFVSFRKIIKNQKVK